MKRRDLEKHLREHGCDLDHHGSNHDVWINLQSGVESAIPRHREIKPPMVRGICRQLGISPPRNVA